MPDITDLLQAAARPPAGGPDLAAVVDRARVLRRQQAAVRAGTLAVVALLIAPLIARGQGTASQKLRQDEIPGVAATATVGPSSTATIAPGSSPRLLAHETPTAPGMVQQPGPQGDEAGSPVAVGTAPNVLRPTSPRPSATSTSASYPRAPACQVTSRDLVVAGVRECRFTATRAGGWRLDRGAAVFVGYDPANTRVLVTRAGRAVYDSDEIESDCGNGVIRPGDQVVVRLETHNKNYQDFTLGAGEGYGC